MKNFLFSLSLLVFCCFLVACGGEDPEEESLKEETPNDQVVLSDEWEYFNPDVYTIREEDANGFHLELAQNALWYQGSRGGLIYKQISGDFTITATVQTRKRTQPEEQVECEVCLGGLMARSPDTGNGENYVHIVTGNTPVGIGVETKMTTNSTSEYTPVNDGTSDFQLRINREGSVFTLYKRTIDASEWTLAATYEHEGMPDTLQVGINIYTAEAGNEVADLGVFYQDIVIE